MPSLDRLRISPLLAALALVPSALTGCDPTDGSTEVLDAEDDRGLRAPQDGEPGVLASNQRGPALVALDDEFVYWANQGDGSVGGGEILRVSKMGGEPTVIAERVDAPVALAVDGASVYFTTHGPSATGALLQVSTTGGAKVALANVDPTRGLASANGSIFWTDSVEGQVDRVPSDGGQASSFISDQPGAGPVLFADGWLCWGTQTGIVRKKIDGTTGAFDKQNASDAACIGGCTIRGAELSSEAVVAADVSTASFVIGSAAAATGLVLFVVGAVAEPRSPARSSPSARPRGAVPFSW
jgi:hypothetical protein